MKNNIEKFLGNVSVNDFLANYWQKKPLFVKNAVCELDQLASPQDLMDMGKDENYESRMVLSEGGEKPWQAKLGPFKDEDFKRNDTDKWTLIVHSLEAYFSEFKKIKDMINFVPSWQFDDIMTTYSVKGSSVGAHIDNYDVFIFQGKGKRLWQINTSPDETYIEDLDIKLLKNFVIEEEFEMCEGDMLYLPPGVAHHGISLEESISYSAGFRSFDYPDMAGSFFSDFLTTYNSSKSLINATSEFPKNINEISDAHIDDICDFFKNEIMTRENLRDWFGSYVTRARHEVSTDESFTVSDVSKKIENEDKIFRDEFIRFNFHSGANEEVHFFVNEGQYLVTKEECKVLEELLGGSSQEELKVAKDLSEKNIFIVTKLLNQGALFFN